MKTPEKTQQATATGILSKRQVDDKPHRVRSGENTTAYWASRLFKNTYRSKDGRTIELPEWYVRIRHGGETKRVRLHSGDRTQAADEARSLARQVMEEGWVAVTRNQKRIAATPTIEAVCDAYVEVAESMGADAPRPISVVNYTRCLRQLAELAGAKELRDLTRERVEQAMRVYETQGRKAGRRPTAVTNSWRKVVRNAGAVFSTWARAALKKSHGIELPANPFAGLAKQQVVDAYEPFSPDIISKIERESPALLTGDPKAADPAVTPFAKKFKKAHGRIPQWKGFDFRQPHPDAYCALLLGLHCGLRAREIDFAKWEWIADDSQGLRIVIPEMDTADGFRPKSGRKRRVPLQREVYEALLKARTDASPYIIGGGLGTEKALAGLGYRSPDTFRKLNLWLRQRGVEKGKVRGHPLHTLRKEYGSYIASQFGLFAAQAVLGHQDPKITSTHYAGLKSLPAVASFGAGR